MPSLVPPAFLEPKLVITRPRSGQRNDGMPAVPAGPDSSDWASAAGVATRTVSVGLTDCSVGPGFPACATWIGFVGVAAAAPPATFLATAPVRAGMVSFIPTFKGVSAVMLLATVS